MKRFLALFFPLIYLISSCSTQVVTVPASHIDDLDRFTEMSIKNNKPIMIWVPVSFDEMGSYFVTTRSGKREIMENFLLLRSNSSALTLELRNLYRLPDDVSSLLVLRDSTQIIDLIIPGYIPGRSKIPLDSIAKRSLHIYNNLAEWEEKAIAGTLNKEDWMILLEVLRLNLNTMEMEMAIRDFRVTLTEEDLKDPLVWDFILLYNLNMDNSIVKTLRKHPELVENPDTVFPWGLWIENIYQFNIGPIINSNDSLMLEEMISLLDSLGPDSLKNKSFGFETRMLFSRETGRFEAYKLLLLNRAKTEESFEFFFNEVMGLLHSTKMKDNVEMARSVAEIGLKRNPEDPDHLLLNAFVMLEMKNEKEAVRLAYKAYQKAKTESQTEQAELFLYHLLGPEWYYYSP